MPREAIIIKDDDATGYHFRPKKFQSGKLWRGTVHIDRKIGDLFNVNSFQTIGNGATNNIDIVIMLEVVYHKLISIFVAVPISRAIMG